MFHVPQVIKKMNLEGRRGGRPGAGARRTWRTAWEPAINLSVEHLLATLVMPAHDM